MSIKEKYQKLLDGRKTINTFLPYIMFNRSAAVLDNKRLRCQRKEASQILNILLNRTHRKGWRNHPTVRMWRNYAPALQHYYNCCVIEWVSRGFKNTMQLERIEGPVIYPEWLNDKFCSFHRATLLYKNYEWYKQFNWKEIPKYEYFWPV